ncbi:hypothetical protein KKI24_29370 [bacterium]|nr:hypothetical protein [bacterium]
MLKFCVLMLWIVSLVLIEGCSDQLDYRVGVVTRSVSGKMKVSGNLTDVQPIILVRKYNRTLIESSTGYLYRVSAEIVYPQSGMYTVDMAAEVDRVELMFLGRYHTPVSYQFKRTLGVREYIYNVRLQKDPGWRESYFLLIKPILAEYIVEQRFRMSPSDQLFLGQWMDKTEDTFEKAAVKQ